MKQEDIEVEKYIKQFEISKLIKENQNIDKKELVNKVQRIIQGKEE